MYSVTIRASVMIAHSLPAEAFGPAKNLHGATFVADVTFHAETLDASNIVIDIGKARQLLNDVLAPLNYQNLDDLDCFKGQLTTAEFLARHIHDEIVEASNDFFDGAVTVRLRETHDAWASYSGLQGIVHEAAPKSQ